MMMPSFYDSYSFEPEYTDSELVVRWLNVEEMKEDDSRACETIRTTWSFWVEWCTGPGTMPAADECFCYVAWESRLMLIAFALQIISQQFA